MVLKHRCIVILERITSPTCGHSVYGIPSYYVQKLFSAVTGVSYAPSTATSEHSLVHNELVAASATCQDTKCSELALKVRHFLSSCAFSHGSDSIPNCACHRPRRCQSAGSPGRTSHIVSQVDSMLHGCPVLGCSLCPHAADSWWDPR